MIYTKEWAFIHIPKTAGMNLKRNAIDTLGDSVIKPYRDNHLGYKVMHNPYTYWEDKIKNKWCFTIVRNPYDRAVSMWLYFSEVKEATENFKNKSLYEFYKTLTDNIAEVQWSVTSTQKSFIENKQGTVMCDFFKMESQLNELESKLGFQFTHTAHNSRKPYDSNQYLTPLSRKLIENIFQEDFEYFGY